MKWVEMVNKISQGQTIEKNSSLNLCWNSY